MTSDNCEPPSKFNSEFGSFSTSSIGSGKELMADMRAINPEEFAPNQVKNRQPQKRERNAEHDT